MVRPDPRTVGGTVAGIMLTVALPPLGLVIIAVTWGLAMRRRAARGAFDAEMERMLAERERKRMIDLYRGF